MTEKMQSPDGEDETLKDTLRLLQNWDDGDKDALNQLIEKYLPQLRQFVHRRLPFCLRGKMETWDVVDKVCELALDALRRDKFTYMGVGSFWGFCRKIALNWIYRELREEIKIRQKFQHLEESDGRMSSDPDLIEMIAQKEKTESYEECLGRLNDKEKSAFLLRYEVGLSWALVAQECGYPSPDAGRQAATRALKKIRGCMEKAGHGGRGIQESG